MKPEVQPQRLLAINTEKLTAISEAMPAVNVMPCIPFHLASKADRMVM